MMIFQYLGLVLAGSLFVLGFYVVTRGYIVTLPDNSKVRRGKLLGFWSVYFESVKGYKDYYYIGESLIAKFDELNNIKGFKDRFTLNKYGCIDLLNGDTITLDEINTISSRLQCDVLYKDDCFFLYLRYNVYKFPEWVMNPTSACPVCMSSVFGSFFWWFVFFVVKGCNFGIGYDIWLSMWIPYIVSVAFVNYFITQKVNL